MKSASCTSVQPPVRRPLPPMAEQQRVAEQLAVLRFIQSREGGR